MVIAPMYYFGKTYHRCFYLLLIGSLYMLLAGCGGDTTTTTTTSGLGQVGTPVNNNNNYSLTVHTIEQNDPVFGKMAAPQPGNRIIALDISIANTNSNTTNQSGYYGVSSSGQYSLIDNTTGKSYRNFISIGPTKTPILLMKDNLQPGEQVRGWLTFEIPITANNLVFEYAAPYSAAANESATKAKSSTIRIELKLQ